MSKIIEINNYLKQKIQPTKNKLVAKVIVFILGILTFFLLYVLVLGPIFLSAGRV